MVLERLRLYFELHCIEWFLFYLKSLREGFIKKKKKIREFSLKGGGPSDFGSFSLIFFSPFGSWQILASRQLFHASDPGSILFILMWHWADDLSWRVTVRRVMSVQESGSQVEPCDQMAPTAKKFGVYWRKNCT